MTKVVGISTRKKMVYLTLILWILEPHVAVNQIMERTPVNFKIAFIGDQGLLEEAKQVLNLIKQEAAQAVAHLGDFDHSNNPNAWEALIDDMLGPHFPYFACVGNHDEKKFYGTGGYQKIIESRMNRLHIEWDGDLGVKSSFHYKGIFFVLTAPGIFGTAPVEYIREKLAKDKSIWKISGWHKNMRLMQVGGKQNETGWEVYEESRKGGAIIATAHEHSYSRTHLLSNIEKQTIASTADTLALTPDIPFTSKDEGKTFVFVSGLGGRPIRDQELSGDWWASIYTSDQGAKPGALFGVFNYHGIENMAKFYFKNIEGEIIDSFFVRSTVQETGQDTKDFSATSAVRYNFCPKVNWPY